MLDLLIKNVIVVTTEDGALRVRAAAGPRDRRREVRPGGTDILAEAAAEVVDGRGSSPFRSRRRPPALGHLQPAGGGHGHGEPGQRAGRCHDRNHLHADGPVLPEPDRFPTGSSSHGARSRRGPLLRGLRLPPGADDARAHRRDPFPHHGVRRSVLQDLHVLRQPRTARQVPGPERLPHDPAGERYDLAHFEFVMRGIQKAGEARGRRPDLPVAALRDRGDHDRLHQLVEEAGELTVSPPTARPGHPTPRVSRSPSSSYLADETELPNINLLHLTSAKALKAAMLMQQTFLHVNFRRGDHRAPGGGLRHRLRHRRQGEPAAPRARTSRACGSTSSLATSTGSSAITLLQGGDEVRGGQGGCLRREVRLRWHGVPPAGPGKRRLTTRPVLQGGWPS